MISSIATVARLHPDRPALTVLTKGSREPGDATLTHRQLRAEIARAANLFRLHGINESGGTVAFLCPILPQLFPALLGAQIAGVASSINYLLNEDAIADLPEAQELPQLSWWSLPEAADRTIWTKAVNVASAASVSLKTIFVIGANDRLIGGADELRRRGRDHARHPGLPAIAGSRHWSARCSIPVGRPAGQNSFA